MKWQHSQGSDVELASELGFSGTTNDRVFKLITKDYDFGDITAVKRIYKVNVTFKSVDNEGAPAHSKVKVYYAQAGGTSWTQFSTNTDFSTNYTANGLTDGESSSTWITASLGYTGPIKCSNVFKLKFEAKDSPSSSFAPGFEINDITIVYRILPPR